MPDSQLEKHIKDKVGGHISPIDADALWNDIQKKRKKPFPYWKVSGSLMVLLLLVGGVAFYLLTDSRNKQNFDTGKTATENIQSSSTVNSENSSLVKTIEEEEPHNKANNIQTKSEEQISSKTQIDSNKIFVNKDHKEQFIESLSAESKTVNTSLNRETNITNRAISNESAITKKSKTRQSKNDLNRNKMIRKKTPQPKGIQILKQQPIEDKTVNITKSRMPSNAGDEQSINLKNNLVASKKMPETISKKEDLKITPKKMHETYKPPSTPKTIQFLEMINASLLNNATQLSISKPKLLQMGLLQKTPLFELGVYTSYEYAFRQFTKANINDSTFYFSPALIQPYIKIRKDSETFVESFRAGLFLRKSFKPGFRLTSGIEFAQLTERFNAEINLGRFTVYNGLDSSKYKIVERAHLKKIYNRYKTVNGSVLIGKKFNRQPWSFWFDAGVAFNIKFDYSGQIFRDTNKAEVIDLATNEPSIFKDKLSLGYLVNFGLAYTFSKGYSVEIGPNFQSTSSSINQNYWLDTKHYYLGVRLSLVKQFK